MPKNTVNNLGGLPQLMNALTSESSTNYREVVPLLSNDNFREFATGVMSNQVIYNEFAINLVNRIGLVVIKNRMWKNPLTFLKKGFLDYGDTVEEIFTDIIKAHTYKPTSSLSTAGEVYQSALPDVYAVFHRVNRQEFYPVTVNREILRRAFVSPRALEDFINDTFNQLVNSDSLSEFEYTKELLKVYEERGLFYEVEIADPVDKQSVDSLIEQVKSMATKFTFMSRDYNAFAVMAHTPRDEQIIFIDSDLDAKIDVQSLASAFNLDKVEFLPRKVVLDKMPGGKDTKLILASKELFMIHDTLMEFRDIQNPQTLELKFYLHHHQILSTSRFENAVLFTTKNISVPTKIELTSSLEENLELKAGFNARFNSVVLNEDDTSTDVSQAVFYQLKGANSPNTKIDENGFLNVDVMETSTSIDVISRSLHYKDVKATITVTIVNE